MGLEYNIMTNFDDIEDFFTNRVQEIAGPAVRKSINDTLRAARKIALKKIHNQIKINVRRKSKTAFANQNVLVFKAKGKNPFTMSGTLAFSARPISMITFVIGNTDPIKQKGIKIKKRRKVKVEIRRGSPFTPKGSAFIQKGKKNNVQLFKRKKKGKDWTKQGTPNLSHIIENSPLETAIRHVMRNKFEKILKHEIKFRLARDVDKTNAQALKKMRG